MIPVSIIWMFLAHWFCDFVLQTDYQARSKSKNWYSLSLHVFTYTCYMVALVSLIAAPTPFGPARVAWFVNFTLITFATHFITDAITSRITARLYAQGRIHGFFVVVGFDQFVHMATLVLTLNYLAKP